MNSLRNTLVRPVQETGTTETNTLRLKPTRANRRPALAAASALIIVVCGVLFASLYANASGKASVLEVTHTVTAGSAITTSELKSVDISLSAQGSTIPTSAASSIIGKSASVTIPAGSILNRADVTSSWQPPAGESLVGVGLRQSQQPASGVQPGEYVDVVLTGAPGAAFQSGGTTQPASAIQGQPVTGGAANNVASSTTSGNVGTSNTNSPNVSSSIGTGAGTGSSTTTANASSIPGQLPMTPLPVIPGDVLASGVRVIAITQGSQSSQTSKVLVSLLVPSSLAPAIAYASSAGQVAVTVVRPGTN